MQKRALRIINGYDTHYNDALEQSGPLQLADYRLKLCDAFFAKDLANPEYQLFKDASSQYADNKFIEKSETF